MKKGQKLYVVDLESVSFLRADDIRKIASDDSKYHKMPFLYLIMSYLRNEVMTWADNRLTYLGKDRKGDWMVYEFIYNKVHKF